MINFIENTCDIKKYNIDKNAKNVISTNSSMLNLHNIIDQAESPIKNNLEGNNMEITNEEKNKIFDLLLKYHTDCFKKLKDFLSRPSTPQ